MKSTSILSFPAKGLIGTRPTRFPAGFFTKNFDSVGCLVSFHCTSYFFCISFRCIFGSQSSFVFPTIRFIFHQRRRPSYASHCALHAFASSCFIFPLKMFTVRWSKPRVILVTATSSAFERLDPSLAMEGDIHSYFFRLIIV